MSRVGKKIRTIPSGVTVEVAGSELLVKGPKGELKIILHPRVTAAVAGNELTFKVANDTLGKDRALWGTFSSIAANMLKGVTEGYKKQLEINGVGFKAAMKGETLALEVGYSHSVEYKAPKGVKITVEKNIITVEGADKQLVGEAAAQIRNIRKPEPYKGKGIKYIDEVLRHKVGKTAAKTATA